MSNNIASIIDTAVSNLTEDQVEEFYESQDRILWIDTNILSENDIEFTLSRAEYAESRIDEMVDRWDDNFIKNIGA